MRYHLFGWILRKRREKISVGEVMERKEPLYTAAVHVRENSMEDP
jgi:hypothetical protein